jgi:FkbM family methyltransferase
MDAQTLRAAIRRVTGRRAHLRRGYHVLLRPTGDAFPIGGAVLEASVTALRNGKRFRAKIFEDRVFVLDEMIVGGQYLEELRRLRRGIEGRASDGRVYLIDGGANVGLFTLLASLVLRVSVHSDGFEPFEENRCLCENNWRDRDHRVHPESLSDEDDGQVPLYLRSTTGATIMPLEPRLDDTPIVKVSTARLDTLWPRLAIPRVDLVKLDIEGAEESALAGSAGVIEQHRPFILCSYEHRGNNRQRLVELVTRRVPGYAIHDDAHRRLLTFTPPDASAHADALRPVGAESSARR